MINSIPFSIPKKFAAGLADGSLTRIGTLIKDAASGKIVAHVQETGLAQAAFDAVKISGSLFSPLTSALELGSSMYANVQLKNITKMVDSLQHLQYSNIAVSLGGLGVSIIGFTIVNKRLNGIENELSQMIDRIDYLLDRRELERQFHEISILSKRAEKAYGLKNPAGQWMSIANDMLGVSDFFERKVSGCLNQDVFNANLFGSLVDAYSFCNAAQIECSILANELPYALAEAESQGEKYQELFDDLTAPRLVRKLKLNHKSSFKENEAQQKMKELVQGIREATDSALTKPYLIQSIIEKEIDGKEYLNRLREEKEHPILMLSEAE
ncbi:MAG: hypothetical protein HOF24_03160 [Flavobacteriaceae bacterium]|jgi:hypothetical protein|nr:hypothetical protein [Flavobacteriaceae bacterium]